MFVNYFKIKMRQNYKQFKMRKINISCVFFKYHKTYRCLRRELSFLRVTFLARASRHN